MADIAEFSADLRDNLKTFTDLRSIFSVTIVPGSIVANVVATSTAVSNISRGAAQDLVFVDYRGVRYHLVKTESNESSSSAAGPIAGGIVAALVILVCIVVILLIVRRKREQKPSQSSKSMSTSFVLL